MISIDYHSGCCKFSAALHLFRDYDADIHGNLYLRLTARINE